MGCCCGSSSEHHETQQQEMVELNRKHRDTGGFGLVYKRKIRDVFCLLLFLIVFAGFAAIGYWFYQTGDPDQLKYGDDYLGNLCGKDNTRDLDLVNSMNSANLTPTDHTNAPFLYYLNPVSTDIIDLDTAPRICVSECPRETSIFYEDLICKYGYSGADDTQYTTVVDGNCFFPYASIDVFYRCIPEVLPNGTSMAIEAIDNLNILTTIFSSVNDSLHIIGGAAVVTIVLGIIFVIFMRLFAGFTIWTLVFLAILIVSAASFLLFWTAEDLEKAFRETTEFDGLQSENTNFAFVKIISYVLAVIAAIIILFVLFNASNIQLSILLFQEVTRSFRTLPLLVLFPVIPLLAFLCLSTYFIWGMIYIVSSSLPVYEDGEFVGYKANTTIQIAGIGFFFLYLWFSNIIIAFNSTVIAGSLADWYHSSRGKNIKPLPILRAFGRTLRYSLGSIVFGAFIIALVTFLRIMLEFLHQQSKTAKNPVLQTCLAGSLADWYHSSRGKNIKPLPILRAFGRTLRYSLGSIVFGAFIIALVTFLRIMLEFLHQQSKTANNPVLQTFLKLFKCCFACFQRFIEFLNTNAYIMIGIYGYGFCVAARRGLAVVVASPMKVVTVTFITDFILILGKLSIAIAVTSASFVYMRTEDTVRVWIIPLILIFILSFLIISCFFVVFEMSVKTLLFCVLEDINRNGDNPQYLMCSKRLYHTAKQGSLSKCCGCF
eukprot:TRINITY_DN2227_c0_g1_i1.p1 TRINITY_DN2227_c0_g1~~TRINITY_DN2227_c0_g1_i1.p1  ORF type:complete len:714 (-),score=93.86 TRINITY_DN2227_c0_g1_i1:56-2197(-)